MFEFRTLGTIDLRADDGRRIESVLQHSKHLGLLAYLCASHPLRLHRRDTLVALLWPEFDDAHAHGALRQELTRLRRALGPATIVGEGREAVGVDGGRLWSDVQAFQDALQAGRPAEALRLWGGEFLPGVHLDGGEFERWLDATRGSLTRSAIGAAERLIEEAERAGELQQAVAWGRRLTELEPYDELAWQRLISLLDASGDRAGALAAYELLTARLRQELEVEPSPETQALMARIRARAPSPAATADGASTTVSPLIAPHEENGGARPSAEHSIQLPAAPDADATWRSARTHRARRWWLVAAGLVAVTAAATALVSTRRQPAQPASASPPVIHLLPVENHTGDRRLDPLASRVAERLAQGLAQLTFIQLSLGEEVVSASAVVSTTLYRDGSRVAVQPRLVRAGDERRVLEMPEPVRLSPEPLDASLDTLVARVLAAVAANFDPRLAVPPGGLPYKTPSWEAYLELVRGSELFGRFRFAEAAQHMLRAYDMDHGYVNAAAFGAIALVYAGQPGAADSVVSVLMAAQDSLPEWARLWCEWLQADLHGRRSEAYRAITDAFRGTAHPIARQVAAREALRMNRPREAARLLGNMREGHGWWLNWTEFWEVRGGAYHVLGEHQAELAAVLPGRALFPESLELMRAEIRARVGLGQADEAVRLVEEALTMPPARGTALPPALVTPADIAWTAAQELDYHGQAASAAKARKAALAWLLERGDPTREERLLRARLLLETGDVAGAQRAVDRLAPLNDPESLGLAGLVAATRGDAVGARRSIARLEALRSPYLSGRHLLQVAGVQAAMNEPDAAIRTLRRAFATGLSFGVELHAMPMLRPLVGRPDFVAMLRPRG